MSHCHGTTQTDWIFAESSLIHSSRFKLSVIVELQPSISVTLYSVEIVWPTVRSRGRHRSFLISVSETGI